MSLHEHKKLKVKCDDCGLYDICLPAGLESDDLDKLERTVKRSQAIQKGDYIFRIDDPLKSLYAVRSGTVKLVRDTDEGDEQILGFYFPGELLGFDAIESNMHRCSAIALETSSFCAFPYNRLEELGQAIPGLQHQMLRLMSKELVLENEMLLSICNKKADERVATFLLNLSQRFSRLGYSASQFKLSMSRQEIATYLGLTIETVSRIISRFQKDGILATERKQVIIEDMERLRKLCVGC